MPTLPRSKPQNTTSCTSRLTTHVCRCVRHRICCCSVSQPRTRDHEVHDLAVNVLQPHVVPGGGAHVVQHGTQHRLGAANLALQRLSKCIGATEVSRAQQTRPLPCSEIFVEQVCMQSSAVGCVFENAAVGLPAAQPWRQQHVCLPQGRHSTGLCAAPTSTTQLQDQQLNNQIIWCAD